MLQTQQSAFNSRIVAQFPAAIFREFQGNRRVRLFRVTRDGLNSSPFSFMGTAPMTRGP
jgi:hypothetical protein